MKFERIAIADIVVPERLRAVEEEHAIAIAQSIVEHDGKQVASTSVALVDGGPRYVHVLEDVPPFDLIAYAANRRWQVETGGITVGGSLIDTSRESQAMITGAYNYSQVRPDKLIKFKAASGWVELDAATVAAIATAVGDHVQACFDAESEVVAAIAAGTVTTVEQVDVYF